jgi:hypothetical protein
MPSNHIPSRFDLSEMLRMPPGSLGVPGDPGDPGHDGVPGDPGVLGDSAGIYSRVRR